MKFLMKLSATFLILFFTLSAAGYFFWYKHNLHEVKNDIPTGIKKKAGLNVVLNKIKLKAINIKKFARLNNYDTTYCFMVDMHIASGKKRFFIYNLIKDSVENAGLVTHGCGRNMGMQIQFSNDANSLCTSLGKFKIGYAYNGKFGLAFKIYGLDATNSNAFSRSVVLHSMSCIPNHETGILPICESWGCPAVSPSFLNELKIYIDRSQKPLLMDIYY